jgi:hypothetical protein
MNLLTDWETARVREDFDKSNPNSPRFVEFGILEPLVATGRATCRACGQRIAKGEPSAKFAWDFNGCGSWTAQEIHIHRFQCPLA